MAEMPLPVDPLAARRFREETLPESTVGRLLLRNALWIGLLLFLLQALPYLSYRWVTDESWYAGPAYSMALGHGLADPAIGPNDLENRFDARPPGTAIVIAGFFKLFGAGQTEARLGSVFAGLAVVFLTYRLTRDLFGEEGAAIATLLVATDNLLVLTSRTARPEALTTMAIFAAMLAMKIYARRGAAVWAGAAGLLMALGTMFHITVLGYIVSLGIAAILIDRARGRLPAGLPVAGAFWYTLGYAAGLVPFAAWILTAPLGRDGFRAEFLSRAIQTSALLRVIQERRRYSDLLGFNMIHGHGLESLPLRLPIPLLFLFATYLLWRFRRTWFYTELLLLVPTVLWLIYTVNKSSRYLALVAPLFAIAIGAAVAATSGRRTLHRAMLAMGALVVVAQLGANIYLLRGARKANYSRLGAELRAIIPSNETAYATITFWLALHDRPFICYERTDPLMAATTFHVRYFVVGDRMMTNAESFGDKDFYATLNEELQGLETHSDLAGRIHDPYYGDLKIYKLRE